MNNKVKIYYRNIVRPNLLQSKVLDYKNIYQVPQIQKIIINRGLGNASQNTRILETSHRSFIQYI